MAINKWFSAMRIEVESIGLYVCVVGVHVYAAHVRHVTDLSARSECVGGPMLETFICCKNFEF